MNQHHHHPKKDHHEAAPVTPPESSTAPHEADATIEPTQQVESKSPLETAIAERDEYRDQLLRALAEMDNVRKRMNRERDEERKYAVLPIARDLLPAIDNLGRALEAGRADHNADALLQGVQMVANQLDEILQRHGVKAIAAHGQPFDPNFHEALQQVPSAEHPPLTVLQEFERGYHLHDRVVRPTKVIVSSAPAPASK